LLFPRPLFNDNTETCSTSPLFKKALEADIFSTNNICAPVLEMQVKYYITENPITYHQGIN
jgi:hypothetical protein